MKRIYLKPSTEMGIMRTVSMVCSSISSKISSDADIDYGGVDEDGTKEPASRRRSVWEDEDELEEDF